MKINRYVVVLILVLFCSKIFAFQEITHCSVTKIQFKCISQNNGNYSLEGNYYSNGQRYSITTRRAWDHEWCSSALKKIHQIMNSEEFCIKSEAVSSTGIELTLEEIYSHQKQWTYFD